MRTGAVRHTAITGVCAAVAAATMMVFAPPAIGEETTSDCPDVHVLAVQGTTQSSVNAPTDDDTGELSAAIIPVLNAAHDQGLKVERTYIPYPASFGGLETQSLAADYKTSVMDGYNRLTQVAARVLYQCPTTKLVLLGYSQGGHAVSMLAQQIGSGEAGPITAGDIALVVTYGDPTRGPDASLFPNRPGQVGPDPWPGTDKKTRPSATKFGDLYHSPKGQGIGPERDIAKSFGSLDGRVAQWCLDGDLACSAPKSISLAKVGLEIAGQSNLNFTHDPFGVVTSLAAATANTFANGMSTFMDQDVKGKNLADMYFDGDASISKRLQDAADPRNADEQTNPLVAVLKSGQMVMSSMTSFVGQVLNSSTLGSLIDAGVQVAGSAATGAVTAGLPALAGGPAAAAAAASAGAAAGAAAGAPGLVAPAISILGNAATAALNIIPPQSAEKKVSSIFDLLINEVKANADLPQLLLDSRLWNQQATHGGYRTARVAIDGSTPMGVTADWIIAAARDLHTEHDKQAKDLPSSSTKTSATNISSTPAVDTVEAPYDRAPDGDVSNPIGPPVGDHGQNTQTVADAHTPGDVRITSSGQTAPPTDTTTKPLVWVSDGPESIAARVVASNPTTPAGTLLHIGSP
ncbi:cutinase family protein, partial [Nocardia vermiculata]